MKQHKVEAIQNVGYRELSLLTILLAEALIQEISCLAFQLKL